MELESLKRRYVELHNLIEKARSVEQEYSQLKVFLSQAYDFMPESFPEGPLPGTPQFNVQHQPLYTTAPTSSGGINRRAFGTPTIQGGAPVRVMLSDAAAFVLKRDGAVHLKELLKKVRDEGWTGSGDDSKDEKTLYNSMSAKPHRFENTGKNIWKLAEAELSK
jgi:hypothetical protein